MSMFHGGAWRSTPEPVSAMCGNTERRGAPSGHGISEMWANTRDDLARL